MVKQTDLIAVYSVNRKHYDTVHEQHSYITKKQYNAHHTSQTPML